VKLLIGDSGTVLSSLEGLDSNLSMWAYNSLDDVYTREVGEVSREAINQMGLQGPHAFQHDMFHPVLHAMLRGVKIDLGARKEMDRVCSWELDKRAKFMKDLIGFDLNLRSPQQIAKLLYEDMQLPTVWKRNANGGKSPTTDDEALEILRIKEPRIRPLVKCIQETRSLGVFLSTFIRATLGEDNRMRCSYNLCGTESYRLASRKDAFGSGTNLQNVPMGGEEDDSDLELPNIRKIFVPDTDQEFFDIDLSKADLRIVAAESDCKEMKAMLAEGRDPYVETAREYYHDATITKLNPDGSPNGKYATFKAFSHGTHYLGTPYGLSQRIGLSVHEADKTQKWYFGRYPEIKAWQGRFIEEIKRTHRVSNCFGYVRHYLGRIDDSTFREAISWKPQSTVGLLINKIWRNIWDATRADPTLAEVLLQVHDSLCGQFPVGRREQALQVIRAAGQVVLPYPDPLIIPMGIKTSTESWGACA
jgi:DNA polymerase-1